MDFCKFYGISAPQLLIYNLPNSEFQSVVKPLNNVIDYVMVRDLKIELEYLKGFLQSLKYEYQDPKTKRLERRLMKNLNRRKSGKEIAEKDKMTDEEIREAEEFLKTQNKSISIYQERNGKEFYLTDNEIKILEFYMRKQPAIERYINNIEEKTFSERKVFGKKLDYVCVRDGSDILYRVSRGISSVSKDKLAKKQLYKNYRNDIELLKSFVDEEVHESDKAKEDTSRLRELPEYIVGEDRKAMQKMVDFNQSIKSNGKDNIKIIYNMYKIATSFTVDFYNRTFAIDATRAEYEKMFDRLTDLGLVGLNLYTEEFFNLFIKSVTFAKEEEIVIAGDSELAKAIKLIDRLLQTDLRTGSAINA